MPDAAYDATYGDPDARRVREELDNGLYGGLRDLLRDTADPDARAFHVAAATERTGRPAWLDAWVAAEPRNADAYLVRGAHGVGWAWQARGHAQAEYTERSQFHTFWERLAAAEEDLERAIELAPDDPEPWAHLVTSARGLEVGQEELGRRFKEVIVRHPWHRRAHAQMLQGLAPKWSGSVGLLFDFARDRALAAPPGSPLPSLVAEAHIEMWLDCDTEDAMDAYFRSPSVQRELHAAADLSVRSPHWDPRPEDARADNVFAFCFLSGGDAASAAARFAATGGHVSREPWLYLGEGIENAYLAHRDRAFAALPRTDPR